MFSTTYTQAEVEELLMRPVRITALMNELAALRTANVISANTGSDVANLIFNEIQAQTQPMRDDWQILIDGVKDYSRHLYQTTDELNDHMRTSVNPTSDMPTYRIQVDRINDVYDSVKDGFDSSVSMDIDLRALNLDFFATNALYKVDYANNYANIATTHTANTISAITTRIFEADSLLGEQKTTLTDLRDTFPEIAVESFDSSKYKEAVYLPNYMVIQLLEDNHFRIYNDSNMRTDIGSIFDEETLIANRDEVYTFDVRDCVAGQDSSRRFMVIDHIKHSADRMSPPLANVEFISQNTLASFSGSKIKSLAFEGSGPLANTPQYNANTASGRDSVIRYTDSF